LRQLNGIPLGGWGSVVVCLFGCSTSISDMRARGARLVVLAPVVPAWFESPVVRIARYGQRGRVLGVIPIEARCAGVIECWCGALMPGAGERV